MDSKKLQPDCLRLDKKLVARPVVCSRRVRKAFLMALQTAMRRSSGTVSAFILKGDFELWRDLNAYRILSLICHEAARCFVCDWDFICSA